MTSQPKDPTSQYKDLTRRHKDLTRRHKDLTRRHKDLTSQNNYLSSDGRSMPPQDRMRKNSICMKIQYDLQNRFFSSGNIPTALNKVVNRTACVIPNCRTSYAIQLKRCGNFTAYFLPRPTSCDQGYCFGKFMNIFYV